VHIRIEGSQLPGRDCERAPGFPGYTNIHVAVQRKKRPDELLDPVPGDATEAAWTLDCEVNGSDIRGPYIQGPPGGRFIYLNWGTVDANGGFDMFRRAKVMLADVPEDVLAAAAESGRLVGRLGLTDAKGQPLCASVRPPQIQWTAS
jgi:Family of unknown function (DUF5990)